MNMPIRWGIHFIDLSILLEANAVLNIFGCYVLLVLKLPVSDNPQKRKNTITVSSSRWWAQLITDSENDQKW